MKSTRQNLITKLSKLTFLTSDEFGFPSNVECDICEGAGGFDERPRSGGDPMEPDDYYWNGCNHCGERGYFFNPTTKCIRRWKVNL